MVINATYTVNYRRKREGRTNYKKRLALLKSKIPRLVIRRSNKLITIQIVNYEPNGDKVITSFRSNKLDSFGWKYSKNSIPACYLSGLVLGKLASAKKITEAILDIGLQTPKKDSKIYAALKGVVDAGLNVPCDESVFPSEDRINGTHIAQSKVNESLFTKYKKENLEVSKISEVFETTKKNIMK